MISKNKLNKIYSIIPFVASMLIVFAWFRQGIMLAKAEEGIPYYDLARTAKLYSSYFYDSGLGQTGVYNIPRSYFFGFLSLFENLGFLSWQIQALVFLILITVPLYFLPKLVDELFPKMNKLVGVSAAIFYLLNIFTLTQVFTRFVLSLVFLWSYLPLFMFIWVKYINTRSYKFLFLLILSTFVFAPSFVIFSPLLTLSIGALFLSISKFINSKEKIKVALFSLIGILIWLASNLWWIYPFYKSKDSTLVASNSLEQNTTSLIEVSQYFPMTEIFLLRQKYMLGETSPYFNLYKDGEIRYFLSIFLAIVMFLGLVSARKLKSYKFVLPLFVVSLFLIKGANPPFGRDVYEFLFKHIFIFQIYRNPYEKLGSLYLLAYSIFFGLGVLTVANKFKKINTIIVSLLFILACCYLTIPILNGSLYPNTSYVVVPTYYQEVNNTIETLDSGDSRILQLPFLRSSVVRKDWNYYGEEPSEFLYDKASISRTVSIQHIDDIYYKLGDHKFMFENKNYSKILALMKIKYIVLNKDVILGSYHQEGFDDSRAAMMSWNGIKHMRNAGKLELYENSLVADGRLYFSDKVSTYNDLESLFTIVASDSFDPDTDTVILKSDENIFKTQRLSLPNGTIEKLSNTKYKVEIIDNKNPFVLVLANNYDYNWQAEIDAKAVGSHIKVNGYANGWYIDKMGDYEIEVKYTLWPWE